MEIRDLDDRYYIGGLLGEGGLARVYRYEPKDVERDCPLALKVMKPESRLGLLGSEFSRRFEFEGAVSIDAAAIRPDLFPQIVYVRRDVEGRAKSIVMELLEGWNLREYLGGQVTYMDAVSIVLDVLLALQSLHLAGIIHRDVKLENVFICKDGVIKLLDFGLSGSTSHPMKGNPACVIGTPNSLAPESFRGVKMDPRSDIYSAGVVLYECLALKKMHKFRGFDEADEFHASGGVPAPLTETVPNVLRQIVMKMVESDMEKRYQTAQQALRALAEFAVQEDPSLRTVEPYYSVLGRVTDQYQWL